MARIGAVLMRSPSLAFGAFVIVTMLLAGCAANIPDTGTPSIPTQISADQLTPAGGKAMLATAASAMPDKYGMDLTLTSGSAQLMVLHGAFDNASGVSYAEITGNASAFSGAAGQQSAAFAPYLEKGITIYATKEGSLYYANGTAFVFPPASAGAASSSIIPSPEDGPLGAFMRPVNGPFKDVLSENNVTIESVKPTTIRGHAAVEMQLRTMQGDQSVSALVDVFADPPRLAHVESALPRAPNSTAQDPFAGAMAVADFSYGDDVKLQPSATVTRALGLAYTSDANALSGWHGKATWTFLTSGGVGTSEVEAQLKDTSQSSAAQSMGFTDAPTKWALKLSDATKTADGVTIAFHDANNDGKVGAGDTLTITTSDDSADAPVVVLKDLVTGAFVVPGAGLFVLLGVLASAALVARRRV